MKRLTVTILALTLLAPLGAAEPLANQLENGDFEDWSDEEPAEWRILSDPVEQDSNAYEGDWAAKLLLPGDVDEAGIAQLVSLDEDDAPIVPNTEYEITFAADLSSGDKDDSAEDSPNASAVIEWRNALGETTDTDTVDIDISDGYLEYNATFQAPEDATEADIQFLLDGTDTTATDTNLKVDAVEFGPADPTS